MTKLPARGKTSLTNLDVARRLPQDRSGVGIHRRMAPNADSAARPVVRRRSQLMAGFGASHEGAPRVWSDTEGRWIIAVFVADLRRENGRSLAGRPASENDEEEEEDDEEGGTEK